MTTGSDLHKSGKLRRVSERRARPHPLGSVQGRIPRRVIITVLVLLLFGGLAALVVHYLFVTVRVAIVVDGHPLAALGSEAACRRVIRALQTQYAPEAPEVVSFLEGEFVLKRVWNMPLVTHHLALEALSSLTPVWRGTAIVVNNKPVALLANRVEAVKALALMQEQAARGREGIPTFREHVRIAEYTFDRSDATRIIPVMTAEVAAATLSNTAEQRTHTVRRGESFSSIAKQHGISVEKLMDLNPELSPTRLQPGDVLLLDQALAPINVILL